VETESDTNRWIGGGWKIFGRLIFLRMAAAGRNKIELKKSKPVTKLNLGHELRTTDFKTK
jgi:hypothetical protein